MVFKDILTVANILLASNRRGLSLDYEIFEYTIIFIMKSWKLLGLVCFNRTVYVSVPMGLEGFLYILYFIAIISILNEHY